MWRIPGARRRGSVDLDPAPKVEGGGGFAPDVGRSGPDDSVPESGHSIATRISTDPGLMSAIAADMLLSECDYSLEAARGVRLDVRLSPYFADGAHQIPHLGDVGSNPAGFTFFSIT